MISDGFGPSQIEIKSLGIGLAYTSNIEKLNLNDDEYLVVGEQYTPNNGDDKDTIYNLIINKDVVGVHTSRKRIDPSLDSDTVKTSGLYVGSDIICDGKVVANSLSIKNFTISNDIDNEYVSNLTIQIQNAVESISENNYLAQGYSVATDNQNDNNIDINNIFSTSFITLGNIGDTYGNTHKLNIAETANYNIRNAQLSIKNKINTLAQDEPANFRIGIIGDTAESPAIFSTTEGMPISFHVGLKSDKINEMYSARDGLPNYGNELPSLTIDSKGNIGLGAITTDLREYDNFSNYTKLKVVGGGEIDDIYTYDRYSEKITHIDDIYIRKIGKTFEANQIIPGDFDSSGPFRFNSDLYVGNNNSNILFVEGKLNVLGDVQVSNYTYLNNVEITNDALFNKSIHISDDSYVDNNVIVGGDVIINNGSLKINDTRINISSLNPIMVDASIADSSNINGSNVLIFASSEVISYTSGSNMVVPGKLGVGIDKNTTYNEQFNIDKRNKDIYEISLRNYSYNEEDIEIPSALFGHPDFESDIDRSLILQTNNVSDKVHNIQFYAGIDRDDVKNTIPQMTIHQNKNIGINTKDPVKELHVNGDVLCNDVYITRNEKQTKAKFFVSKKEDYVKLGDESQDFFYLNDPEGINKYTINITEKDDILFKGLNVSGGIHSTDEGYYENNLKLATLKIINDQKQYAYINNNISIGIQNPSNPDLNTFHSPLNVRNISRENYNDSIIRIYRGNRQGGSLNSAKYSGIDICEYDLYRVDILNDINKNKWFIYKSHSQQKDTLDSSAMVGPLQFGYTDGTEHPEHYGMTMYYDKNKPSRGNNSSYHIDINARGVYDYTNKNFPKSAMSIYGDLDVHGNINIVNKEGSAFNYLIDGSGISISDNAIQDTTTNNNEYNEDSSGQKHDVVVKGKKVAVLTDQTMFVGHRYSENNGVGATGFQQYIKYYDENIPLYVYQNSPNTDVVGKFVSSSTNTKQASIEIATNNYGRVDKTVVSSKLEVSSNIDTNSTVFKIKQFNQQGNGIDNFTDALSIYNYSDVHNYVLLGSQKFTDVDESQKIALHVDNPVEHTLQLTSENSPSINLHHRDSTMNDFWTIKGSCGENYDKFAIQNSFAMGNYLPDTNTVKDVLVLTRDKLGLNVSDPLYTFDMKGVYDETSANIVNRYSDLKLNQKYSAIKILNEHLQYDTLPNDDMYDFIDDHHYVSGIQYFIEESNIPNIDINDEYVNKDAVMNSNIIASKSVSGSTEFSLALQIDEQFSTSNLTIHFLNSNIESIDNITYSSNQFSYLPDSISNDKFDIFFETSHIVKQTSVTVGDGDPEIELIYNINTLPSLVPLFDIDTNTTISDFVIDTTVTLKIGDEEDNNNLVIVNEDEIKIGGIDYILKTSNIFSHNDILRDINNIELYPKINYSTSVSGPISIIRDDIDITYNYDNYNSLKNSDSSYNILITNVVDFLKDVPDGAYAGTEPIFDKREHELLLIENKIKVYEIFDKSIEVHINISDQYKIYDFGGEITDMLIDINTIDYAPHIILQNNVNFAGQENKYGRTNEIFSKDGSLLFTSVTSDGLLKKSILNIDKDGDIDTIGKLNVQKDIHTNGNIYTNTLETSDLVINGNIYDKLGNIMASFSNYEEMYNQTLTLGADTWNLSASNYSVNSISNIDFVLSGHTKNGFTFTKDIENLGDYRDYDLFTIKEGSEDVLKIIDGGFVGIKVDPDSNYDVTISSKLYSPHVIGMNFEANEMHGDKIVAGNFIGDASLVSNVNLVDKNTDHLTEGTSNRYIINDTYITGNDGVLDVIGDIVVSGGFVGDASRVSNVNLLDKTTDYLTEGTSNRYIVNNTYELNEDDTLTIQGDVRITGNNMEFGTQSTNVISLMSSNVYLESSNISVKGEISFFGTVSSTEGVETSSLKINTNENNVNSIDITREEYPPSGDFLNIYQNGTIFNVSSNYNVGINCAPSDEGDKLQINGNMSVDDIYSRGNVTVDESVMSKNMATSNVIVSGNYSLLDSTLLENSLDVSRTDLNADFVNVHYGENSLLNINKNFNIGIGVIPVDNAEKLQINGDVLADNINIKRNIKSHQTFSSNIVIGNLDTLDNSIGVKKSLDITRSINDEDFLHIHYNTENLINVNKNLNVGIGKIPNEYDGKLQVDGTINASNLNIMGLITTDTIMASNMTILGSSTEIKTETYVTENLEINTFDIKSPALKIHKTYSDIIVFDSNSNNDIFSIKTEIQNVDGIIPTNTIFAMKASGDVDFYNNIQFNNGSIFVNEGNVTSREFIGIGSNLDHILEYYYTSNLKEIGDYLYYTPTRSSNISNYVERIDSELNTLISNNDTNVSNYVSHTSNYLYQYTYDTASNIFQFYDNILDQMWHINNDRLSYGNIDVYSNKIVIKDDFTETKDMVAWYKFEKDTLDYGKNGYDLTNEGSGGTIHENDGITGFNADNYLVYDLSGSIDYDRFNISFHIERINVTPSLGGDIIVLKNDEGQNITSVKVTADKLIINGQDVRTQFTDSTFYCSLNVSILRDAPTPMISIDIFVNGTRSTRNYDDDEGIDYSSFSSKWEDIIIGKSVNDLIIKDVRFYNRHLEKETEIQSIMNQKNDFLGQVVVHNDLINTSNELSEYIEIKDLNMSNYVDTINTDLSGIISTNDNNMSNYVNRIDIELSNYISASNINMSNYVDRIDSNLKSTISSSIGSSLGSLKYSDLSNKPTFEVDRLLVGVASNPGNDNNGFLAKTHTDLRYVNSYLGLSTDPDSNYRLNIDGSVNLTGTININENRLNFTHLSGSIFGTSGDADENSLKSLIYVDENNQISKLTNIKWSSGNDTLTITNSISASEYRIGADKFKYEHLESKPSFTTGKLIVGGELSDNNNFGALSAEHLYYDNGTKRLGVNKETPTHTLHVGGSAKIDSNIEAGGNISLTGSGSKAFNLASESELGIAAASGAYSSSAGAGDVVLKSANNLLLQSGTGQAALIIDTNNNITTTGTINGLSANQFQELANGGGSSGGSGVGLNLREDDGSVLDMSNIRKYPPVYLDDSTKVTADIYQFSSIFTVASTTYGEGIYEISDDYIRLDTGTDDQYHKRYQIHNMFYNRENLYPYSNPVRHPHTGKFFFNDSGYVSNESIAINGFRCVYTRIKMPQQIYLAYVKINALYDDDNETQPSSTVYSLIEKYKIFGTNDDVNFEEIISYTGDKISQYSQKLAILTGSVTKTFPQHVSYIANPKNKYHTYYICINKISANNDGYLRMGSFEIYGTEDDKILEYDGDKLLKDLPNDDTNLLIKYDFNQNTNNKGTSSGNHLNIQDYNRIDYYNFINDTSDMISWLKFDQSNLNDIDGFPSTFQALKNIEYSNETFGKALVFTETGKGLSYDNFRKSSDTLTISFWHIAVANSLTTVFSVPNCFTISMSDNQYYEFTHVNHNETTNLEYNISSFPNLGFSFFREYISTFPITALHTITMSNNTLKYYKNGILQIIVSNIKLEYDSFDFHDGFARHHKFGDIRIYDRELSIGEINQLYTQTGNLLSYNNSPYDYSEKINGQSSLTFYKEPGYVYTDTGELNKESFSISLWVFGIKPYENKKQIIASSSNSTSGGWTIYVGYDNETITNRKYGVYLRLSNNENLLISEANSSIFTKSWNHIVIAALSASVDRTLTYYIKLYLNGNRVDNGSALGVVVLELSFDSDKLTLGAGRDGGNRLAPMTKIDDFRFYNKALTHSEIIALFHHTELNAPQVITKEDLPIEIFDLKKNGSINQLVINNDLHVYGNTTLGNTNMGNTTMKNTTMGNTTMEDVRINGNVSLYHDGSTVQQITFYSSVNRGGDYGYIKYQDQRDGTGENSLLTIGNQNDTDDDIALMPTGKVGINTTAPTHHLHVHGNIRSQNMQVNSNSEGSSVGIYFGTPYDGSQGAIKGGIFAEAINSYSRHHMTFCLNTDGSNATSVSLTNWRFRINTNGHLYQSSNEKEFSQTSDKRIKDDINEANYELCYENIKKLALHRFKYKKNSLNLKSNDIHVLGFIAQDVEKLFPKNVFTSENEKVIVYNSDDEVIEEINDCKSINTEQIQCSLYGALKFAMKKIDQLENDKIEIFAKIAKLEKLLSL